MRDADVPLSGAPRPKRLLVLWHSQGAGAARMKNAVVAGAQADEEVDVVCLRMTEAVADDLLAADGCIFGTPENFGALAGATKDFLDRVFYPCEPHLQGRPYAIFVKAGNDGTGALRQLERILTGLRMKAAAEPIVVVGELDAEALARCEALGAAMAAGLAMGIF